MAAQIAEGFYLLTSNTLRGFLPSDLAALRQELEKLQRDARAVTPAQDDAQAYQDRNRRISRISSSLQVILNKQTTRR